MRFIGIDIGTTSVCGMAFDMSDRKSEVITLKNNSGLVSSNPWEKIQNPEILYSLVLEILNSFSGKNDKISGIGFTGQMHGILYIDGNGNAVSPLYTWEDKRGNQVLNKGQTYAGFLSETAGYKVASGYGLVTHFFNLKCGLVPKGAKKFCTIMDYIVMKLTGEMFPLIDPTNAASLGLFDLVNLNFDREALLRVGINPDILPDIGTSGTYVGLYKEVIPVYSAISDNQASYLGSVSQIDKSILVNIGTGSQISFYTEELVNNDSLEIRPFPGGGYLLVGAALYGGKSLSLLKSFFEQTISLFAPQSTSEIDFYEKLNTLNRTMLTESTILKVKPLFNGTRRDIDLKGIISHISDINFTPENLMAGFLNGICMELVDFFNELPVTKRCEITFMKGSGNAIRRNPILKDMLEISFNRKLSIPSHTEEAAFGACLCALVGGNHISGFNDAGSLIDYNFKE